MMMERLQVRASKCGIIECFLVRCCYGLLFFDEDFGRWAVRNVSVLSFFCSLWIGHGCYM